MTKKDFVALADALRIQNQTADGRAEFTPDHLLVLADFCASQDSNFNRKQWMDYIDGMGRPGDELMFVEPGCTIIPAVIVEDKLVPDVSHSADSSKVGAGGSV